MVSELLFLAINNSVIGSNLSRFINFVMKSPYNNSIQTLVVSIKEENSDEIDYLKSSIGSIEFKVVNSANNNQILLE